jgi:hypothetical protein
MSALAMALTTASGEAAPPAVSAESSESARLSPDRAACLSAHRAAQELRQSSKLVEAGQKLLICSSASCPGPVISDCGTWINELEEATPTLVFEIEVNGHAATEAKVFVDDVPVADWSHAVKVDPGTHTVRAELPPFDAHEEKLLMAEGHRRRLVSITFASSKPPQQPPVDTGLKESPGGSPERPVPVVVYPLVAAGVLGLAGFGVFGGLGRAKQNDLERSCESHCTDHDLSLMKTEYLIGDVSLGVGVAALIGAAVVYFTRPEKPRTVSLVSLELGTVGGNAARGRFWGASATMGW